MPDSDHFLQAIVWMTVAVDPRNTQDRGSLMNKHVHRPSLSKTRPKACSLRPWCGESTQKS